MNTHLHVKRSVYRHEYSLYVIPITVGIMQAGINKVTKENIIVQTLCRQTMYILFIYTNRQHAIIVFIHTDSFLLTGDGEVGVGA